MEWNWVSRNALDCLEADSASHPGNDGSGKRWQRKFAAGLSTFSRTLPVNARVALSGGPAVEEGTAGRVNLAETAGKKHEFDEGASLECPKSRQVQHSKEPEK